MKRFATISMILIVSLITNNLFAQKNDFNFVGAGARAAGMGNAFIGVSDDATAISWNPAGLSQLLRPEASVVGRFTSRDLEFKDFNGETISNSISTISLNFASLVVPLKGEFNPVIAASFQNQLDFSIKGSGFDQNRGSNFSEEGDIRVHTASAAFSMKFNFLHAGLTFSKWFSTGSYTLNEDFGFSMLETTEEHSFSATSFTLGLLADFENLSSSLPLKVGLKFTPAFDLEDESTVSDNSGSEEEIKYTFEMPNTIGLGVSFRVVDALTIAADYEMNNAKDKMIKDPLNSINLSESNENLNQYRIGAEYLIITENIIIPVRAGYKNNPTRRADVDVDNTGDAMYTDQVFASSLNFGAGLIFNNFTFDIAYEYMDFTVKYKSVGVNENQTFNNVTLSGIVYF